MKNKNVLLLHGWYGHSKENWFPGIKYKLELEGYNVVIPDLLNSKYPDYNVDINFIKPFLDNLKEDDIIIGHSLGCVLTLYALKKYNIKNKNIFLVGPPCLESIHMMKDILKDSYDNVLGFFDNIDFESIDISNNIECFLSKNDPYVNFNVSFKEYLNLQVISKITVLKDKGHFNESAGVVKFSELLNNILNLK